MVKGSERRIIVVERLGDPYFERAVFYVRVGVNTRWGEGCLSDKAQELLDRMTREEGVEPPWPEKEPRRLFRHPKREKHRKKSV